MSAWQTYQENKAMLADAGIVDPWLEQDACGIGLVVSTKGEARRDVVEKAVAALKAVWHRGAVDADGKTGDGAGIHVQIPAPFFRDYLASVGRHIASDELFGVGMVFLPRKDMRELEECRTILEAEITRLGYGVYGWRQVPVNPTLIGEIANESRPEIEQILIANTKHAAEDVMERDLYIIRKSAARIAFSRGIRDFYMPSLSCRSIIYKGLFKAEQLTEFYPDLLDARFVSRFAIFHQRFSTNTAPSWSLAQPFRVIAHNGEINTLRGNINWMRSHEANMQSPLFGNRIAELRPVIESGALSDTAALDMVVELLVRTGRSLPMAKHIVIPPASSQGEEGKALIDYCNSVIEPWDGPAAITGYDGDWVIAGLDRNGLRPLRYTLTTDDLLLVGSETGMVPVDETMIIRKGRVGPGQVIGVNLAQGRFYDNTSLKTLLSKDKPYATWWKHVLKMEDMPAIATTDSSHASLSASLHSSDAQARYVAAGLSHEYMELVLHPMLEDGKEAIGSMGDDAPMAVLSQGYRGLHTFFRQNFSQVTNPPIDPIRERRVMTLRTRFGNRGNVLAEEAAQGKHILLDSPVLFHDEYLRLTSYLGAEVCVLDCTFAVEEGTAGLAHALNYLKVQAESALDKGAVYFVLSDEQLSATRAAIPMILAVGALQTLFVALKKRKQVSIIARTSECSDTHALAVLIGVGATAVHPYLMELAALERIGATSSSDEKTQKALKNLRKSLDDGLLKIMSKMGISLISSYRGGCNFEILGLSRSLVNAYFPSLQSRISGIGLEGIAQHILELHSKAFGGAGLPIGGVYRVRAGQEDHAYQGKLIHLLQTAVEKGSYQLYNQYSQQLTAQPAKNPRDLLAFASPYAPVDVASVESITEIRKRFITPAMSLGALSPEAHEILTIAMNRIGAASNSGEGGEDPARFAIRPNGDNPNSEIKQVASARFGVTAEYLNACREIQIKVAQGAKPGEGGQLPGFKVTEMIAKLRHATKGVMLISPPPHHDIYSIEDLAQLIYDLKQINPTALVSVKLVSQAGIGTIASGVAKAMADKILISGHSGGTGASPLSSIKYTGTPWELGLAEANQVLTMNRLRHKVTLQTDGGLRTGRDIVIAAMLGAEEFGIGTAALVAMGCLMGVNAIATPAPWVSAPKTKPCVRSSQGQSKKSFT
jgi:glutamate synthase (NADPH/NADH) large chain